jgi:hypothetical protein
MGCSFATAAETVYVLTGRGLPVPLGTIGLFTGSLFGGQGSRGIGRTSTVERFIFDSVSGWFSILLTVNTAPNAVSYTELPDCERLAADKPGCEPEVGDKSAARGIFSAVRSPQFASRPSATSEFPGMVGLTTVWHSN